MVNHCIEDLKQLKGLVDKITDENFQKKASSLFDSTIGEHVRHSLEFYTCFIEGIEAGLINYDRRKREKHLEVQTEACAAEIDDIINRLNTPMPPQNTLKVEANFSKSDSGTTIALNTSVNRELAYCLEHSVHHQALIKTALKELECLELVDENFGIAASTIRNRNLCVQ